MNILHNIFRHKQIDTTQTIKIKQQHRQALPKRRASIFEAGSSTIKQTRGSRVRDAKCQQVQRNECVVCVVIQDSMYTSHDFQNKNVKKIATVTQLTQG